MTEFKRRALELIEQRGKITSGEFAFAMWPDSNMHRKVSNQGNGACRGKAAWLCGGSYLGRLIKEGLVTYDLEVPQCRKLTQKGRKLLSEV